LFAKISYTNQNHKMKFCLLIIIIFVVACDSNIESSRDYQKRIQSVLKVDIDFLEETESLTYPRRKLLNQKRVESKSKISIREFLSLRECKLHVVIAQRNSLIGKVAPASQLLFNDLQILEHTPECIEQLRNVNNEVMAKKLKSYFEIKKEEIVTSLWKAILGSSENSSFWQASSQPDGYPLILNQESTDSIAALIKFVEKIKRENYHFSKEQTIQVEQHLKVIQGGDGGYLLIRMSELEKNLDKANQAIQQRIDKPLCLNAKPTEKAQYFKNIVNLYFIDKVQIEAVHLAQRYQQLLPSYVKLESLLLEGAPKAYQEWKKQRDQQFELSLNASRKHAKKVQLLFNQCGLVSGMAPGR